jgi:hypothetical protein
MVETEKFSIHLVGDCTGKTWVGDFTTRKYLSHRLKMQRDSIIRQLLGETNPQLSLQIDRAAKLADCQVALVESPDFWKSSDFGLDLVDDNLLDVIQSHVSRIQRETVEGVRKKAAEAVEKIKEDLKKEPDPAT